MSNLLIYMYLCGKPASPYQKLLHFSHVPHDWTLTRLTGCVMLQAQVKTAFATVMVSLDCFSVDSASKG